MAEARELAATGDFHAAILDVNLDGEEIFPVADILAERGLPFVFVTGYGENSLPEAYRARPGVAETIRGPQAGIDIGRSAGGGLNPLSVRSRLRGDNRRQSLIKQIRQLRHERLVGEIEPQRRHRNLVLVERGEIAAGMRA